MAYNMIVVEANDSFGVINGSKQVIIGTKYDTMEFEEATESFIVSFNGKYGVISKNGKAKIDLKYDEIRLIRYSPILYEVKQNNLYGVVDDNGNIIVNIAYKKIGYDGDKTKNLNWTMLIKNIDNGDDGIIVASNETRKIRCGQHKKRKSNIRFLFRHDLYKINR